MVLQKQIIQLPFNGLQTKVDPKLAPLGTYAVLDNWIMHAFPKLVKRDGLQAIGITTIPSNINANYNYLYETGVITNTGLYAYSPVLDQFLSKGLTASPVVTPTTVIANTYTQLNCDSAVTTSTSLQGTVWEDSRGGVRCSIQDITSDTFLQTDVLLSSTGIKPKVAATTNSIVFFWCETSGTALKAQQFYPITNTFGSVTTVSSAMSSTYAFDVVPCLANILIAIVTTGSSPNSVIGLYWNVITGAAGSPSSGLAASASLSLTNAASTTPTISLAVDPTGNYFSVSWQNAAKAVYTKTFYNYLVAITSELNVASATTDAGWGIASAIDSNNNTYIYYSTYNTLHNSFKAKISANITSPAVASNANFILQMAVASKALWYSGNAYVVLSYPSTLQNTYFLTRDDGATAARMFAQVGGGAVTKANCMTSITARPDKTATYICTLLKVTKIIVAAANTYALTTSVVSEQIFFTPNNIDNKSIGRLLNIAGGYLKHYDGSSTVFEQGFHLYPETPTNVASTSGSPVIPNGTYSYIVCWEWVDNQGQLYRSTPSLPLTVVNSGGPSTNTITVRTLPITNKETRFSDTRTNVIAALYRTQASGTTYYRVNQAASTYVYNDPTVQTISIVDNNTDSTIGSNTLLYDTGGVFDNIVLPATNLMAVSKNRVIVAGSDVIPNQVFYSKEKEEGIGIEFSNELSFLVDSFGGDITALATMDDKILIFKNTVVFYIAGVLPDKLGNGAAPYPLLVSSDTGCNAPQSIVLTGKGLMFQSPKGIYLLDRSLQLTYIGNPLDAITTNVVTPPTVTSAVNLPNQNKVLFTNVANQGFVYDTYFDKWYTMSFNFSPVAGILLNNDWYVSSSSQMYKQVVGAQSDSLNSAIISRVKTNWISIGDLDGFVRIFAILIAGDGSTMSSTLKANLYYDFEQFPRESVSIVPYNLSNATTWGSDTTWGSGSNWGGTYDGTYNFVIRPKVQKCSSIMIEIYDDFPTGNYTSSFSFSGISLAVGLKPTWNKGLSYTKRLT